MLTWTDPGVSRLGNRPSCGRCISPWYGATCDPKYQHNPCWSLHWCQASPDLDLVKPRSSQRSRKHMAQGGSSEVLFAWLIWVCLKWENTENAIIPQTRTGNFDEEMTINQRYPVFRQTHKPILLGFQLWNLCQSFHPPPSPPWTSAHTDITHAASKFEVYGTGTCYPCTTWDSVFKINFWMWKHWSNKFAIGNLHNSCSRQDQKCFNTHSSSK